MRKPVIFLLLILLVAQPALAVSFYDTVTCKKVVLLANHRTILVQRVTGKVVYLLKDDGQWMLLKGREKRVYQMLYNAQVPVK